MYSIKAILDDDDRKGKLRIAIVERGNWEL